MEINTSTSDVIEGGLLGSYVDLRNLTSLALFHRALSNLQNEGK